MGPDDAPNYNTVRPVTAEEADELLGTEKLTRVHVKGFDVFPRSRWIGRCTVLLHDDEGNPQEILLGPLRRLNRSQSHAADMQA
ncbi:hypothetical protein ABZ357_19635 [Streptomyces sp. NPDC005917]|uniref:hypothetical protein n=1 Tax=unclassified Streptomyces TaxID=2593676 RepID=UPI003401BABB